MQVTLQGKLQIGGGGILVTMMQYVDGITSRTIGKRKRSMHGKIETIDLNIKL